MNFPRMFSYVRKAIPVYNLDDLFQRLDTYNNYAPCYVSSYYCNSLDNDKPIKDDIVFDYYVERSKQHVDDPQIVLFDDVWYWNITPSNKQGLLYFPYPNTKYNNREVKVIKNEGNNSLVIFRSNR